MSVCYAVIGPPRTGTSAVAGLLQAMGIPTGISAVPAGPANPKGFFEDKDFFRLHALAIGSPESPRVIPTWPDGSLSELTALVRTRSLQHEHWAVKDPRLCMTFSWFREACIETNTTLKVIRTFRSSWASARSLSKLWGGIGVDRAAEILGRYYVAMDREDVRSYQNMLSVEFNTLINEPGRVTDAVAATCGKNPDLAKGWIDKSLRHF